MGTRRHLALLVAAALFAVAPPVADAATYPSDTDVYAVTVPVVEAATALPTRCQGYSWKLAHNLRYDQPAYQDEQGADLRAGDKVNGLFYPATCTADVEADQEPTEVCDDAVHEGFHANGVPHSASGIMRWYGGDADWGPCHHDLALIKLTQLYSAVEIINEQKGRTWCRPLKHGVECFTKHERWLFRYRGEYMREIITTSRQREWRRAPRNGD